MMTPIGSRTLSYIHIHSERIHFFLLIHFSFDTICAPVLNSAMLMIDDNYCMEHECYHTGGWQFLMQTAYTYTHTVSVHIL